MPDINDIRYKGNRGVNAGLIYTPHRTKDGQYIVSKTRFKKDYQYVTTAEEIIQAVKAGLSVRMSPMEVKGRPASLISAEAIIKNSPELFK